MLGLAVWLALSTGMAARVQQTKAWNVPVQGDLPSELRPLHGKSMPQGAHWFQGVERHMEQTWPTWYPGPSPLDSQLTSVNDCFKPLSLGRFVMQHYGSNSWWKHCSFHPVPCMFNDLLLVSLLTRAHPVKAKPGCPQFLAYSVFIVDAYWLNGLPTPSSLDLPTC